LINKFGLFILLIANAFSTNAQTMVQPHMQNFYLSIEQLNEFIVDKNDYLNEKNNEKIKTTLEDFNNKVVELKKESMVKSDDMKFRFRMLSEGLNEAESTFKMGSKDYSFWVLKSTLNNCFACHTQKGLGETNYTFSQKRKYDLYTQAEFLFLYRNYSQANKIFEQLLLDYPKNSISYDNVENSLQRLMFYHVRVLKDELKTLTLIDKILTNDKLPSFVRTNILAWKKYLALKKFRLFDAVKIKDADDLIDFMDTRNEIASNYKLSGQRYLIDLETSAFLFNLLENNELKKLRPWVLYWLAFQEKDYRLSMFDQSTDYYLKECIERYSKSPAAMKCYDLYKEMTIDSYTGSRGTEVPPSVTDQLQKYEKMLKQPSNRK
jgi:hypothetical protein